MEEGELIIEVFPNKEGLPDTSSAIHCDKLSKFLFKEVVKLMDFRFSCDDGFFHGR